MGLFFLNGKLVPIKTGDQEVIDLVSLKTISCNYFLFFSIVLFSFFKRLKIHRIIEKVLQFMPGLDIRIQLS